MATFTFTPSISTRLFVKPRVRTVVFGDGYEQRLVYGLNSRADEWSLTFHCRNTTERDNILDFLDARDGQEAFDWTTPNGYSKRFVCSEWTQDQEGDSFFIINTTFREVFEP
jgi:phage-related protein